VSKNRSSDHSAPDKCPTAVALGLAIPANVLATADEVIE